MNNLSSECLEKIHNLQSQLLNDELQADQILITVRSLYSSISQLIVWSNPESPSLGDIVSRSLNVLGELKNKLSYSTHSLAMPVMARISSCEDELSALLSVMNR